MKRREFLRTSAAAASGVILLGGTTLLNASEKQIDSLKEDSLDAGLSKPLTVIIIGAGNRGSDYARYAKRFPNSLKIVGVSDINPFRRNEMAREFDIPAENCFGDWSEVFITPKKADMTFICTPDHLHHAPCLKSLEQGYHVILEKPAATTEQHCKEILAHSEKYNKMVAICHVLRYAPHFKEMKNLIDSGVIGDLISVRHSEFMQIRHFAHAYVRGNWKDSKESTPIILSKSCHDLDIIRWYVGDECEQVTAFGGLSYFKRENAPKESTDRCLDCKLDSSCTYSAVDAYYRKRERPHVFDLSGDRAEKGEQILNYLRTTNYGRCVFRSENDQCDHYVMNMKFKNGVTAAFSLSGHTAGGGRLTEIMGTKGFIKGNSTTGFVHTDYSTSTWKRTDWKGSTLNEEGHGGGDLRLVRDFLLAVSQDNPSLLSSSIDASIESHVMGFRAEVSRLNGTVETL